MSRTLFSTRLGALITMIGVAVGLGNIWRFPYMTGKFGGASFVLVYLVLVVAMGVPALVAEWCLGRSTRRGPVGAFEQAGLPGGRWIGWMFFIGVTAATAYYTNAIGWVAAFAVGEVLALAGLDWNPAVVLPPDDGFRAESFGLQMLCTGAVIVGAAWILKRGLRQGIEKASRILIPALGISLTILIVRGLTLPGSWAGVEWYLLKFEPLEPQMVAAAMGQAFFSLSLGGTFMVVYGSYLRRDQDLARSALWTAGGDLSAGLLAGLAILPAVFAFSLEPGSGPGLIFFTLPEVFSRIPVGHLFGAVFFLGLLGAAFLSDVAAFEVLVAALVDELEWTREQAIHRLAGAVFVVALPPMVNLRIFVPWDLTFGSGLQTLGALAAVVTVAWFMDPKTLERELSPTDATKPGLGARALILWLRYVLPLAVLGLAGWWLATDVLGLVEGL